ncbi:hypothetical protein A2300_03075 [Candidatus Falkowbacteria bacterium RIFOXYB2_FULL_35_7]|uniref:Four helix bundle protein n=1 Tax=Candidatus Falkowbacteria bacterium RIFOXYC2_FULL_36_12 TaxID=1798002 RepID=A0A1F5SYG0_9BACT|nr:MAG: hypothetical protein A2300_03075 [Candidatus Falkowbacteria bacterium RIFOXYB2_FULL_35_7]OGF31757.1 MAG: hypothetical protein A2478_04700 [Candidatus Falkowbacteria bacterium RIFOXYC2_FULL_36_12]
MKVDDLIVYNKLFNLAIEIHYLTLEFPKYELYEIGSQLRRSSNSAPANLAEGFGNKYTKIYSISISRAQGEIRETVHHLKIAHRKSYLEKERLNYFLDQYDECGRMLYSLNLSILKKKNKSDS